MSRILRRPMFRGGKVESRGTGITSGLGYNSGGRVGMFEGGISTSMMEELTGGSNTKKSIGGRSIYNRPIGPPTGGLSGGNIYTRALAKAKNLPYVGRFAVPLFGSTASALGTGAGVGIGLGALTDFYAKSTKTPEEYRRLKEMGGPNFNFDETNIDVGDVLDYIDKGGEIGEAPGFFPRGGKKKFFEEKGLDPETGLPVEEDDFEVSGEAAKVSPGETALDALFKQGEKKATARKTENNQTPKVIERPEKEESTELKVEDYIKMLGGDKARRRDLSDMLARASASFLGTGGVKEGLAEFMKTEAAAGPSRLEKIEQAAATLDIKDKIASKRAKEQLKQTLAGIDYKIDATIAAQKAADSLQGKSWINSLKYVSENLYKGTGKGLDSASVIEDTLRLKYQKPVKKFTVSSETEIPKLEVQEGFSIITLPDGSKKIFEVVDGQARERTDLRV